MSWWKKNDEEQWLDEVSKDSQAQADKGAKAPKGKAGFTSGIEDEWGDDGFYSGYSGYSGHSSGRGGKRKSYGSSYGGSYYGGSGYYGGSYGGGGGSGKWDFSKSSLGSSLSSYSYGSSYYGYGSSSVGDRNKALKILRQLHRTANAILHSKGQSITVKFPSAKKEGDDAKTEGRSDLTQGIMVIDPKEAIEAYGDAVKNNSLQGRSLIFAQIFTDRNESDFNRYQNPGSDGGVIDVARYLWECASMGAARRNLLEDWSGFRDYCNDYSKTYSMKRAMTSMTGGETEEELAGIKAAVVAEIMKDPKGGLGEVIGRNLAHGDYLLLDYPDDTKSEIIQAIFDLETAAASERFGKAKDLAELLVKDGQNSPKSKGPKHSDGSGDDSESGDGGMFGTKSIDGDKEYASLDAVGDKRTEEYDHTVRASDGNSVQPTIHFLDPTKGRRNDGMPMDEFNKEWAEMKRVADRFVSAFMFRNVESQQYDYGLRSGDLDEGGLHKLGYTDALFCRKEDPDVKKVTVCLLLDESGSMSSNARYASARKVAMAMVQPMASWSLVE
jgi:hypothetical protein